VAGNGEALDAEFRILGALQVLVGGEERPIPGEKLQALLARLLLEPNRAVSTDRLIDDLWGDEPPATARQSLHAHVARLRRVLAPNGEGSPIAKSGRGYLVGIDEERLDATRFRTTLAAARADRRAGRIAAARRRYSDALGLWRGPALDGVSLDAADAVRSELEELRLAALEERIEIDLELGRAAELVPELERLVQANPLRERAWAQLMSALYATGRQADALAAYQDARRELSALGLEPGPALRELEQAILNHDPRLGTSPVRFAHVRKRTLFRHTLAAAVALAAGGAVAATVFVLRDAAPNAARQAAPRVRPNSLVEVDPARNRVVSVTRVGRGPDSIATTEDAVWVTNVQDRTVARVALPTKEVRIVGGAPVAHQVVSGLNGDVWLSSFEEPVVTLIGSRGRIAQGVHQLASGPRRVELPGSAEGLAVGGGYLWVTSPSDSGGEDTVFRVDLRSRRLVSSMPVGKLPLFVAFGYGAAWVANYRGDSVSVIRPGSARAETIPVGQGPLGIAAGAGAVWVVTFWQRELVRIDPETRRVVARIDIGDGPLGVTVGAGAVWVTNRDSRTISRVEPSRNKVVATIRLAAAPYGVRFAHGRLWVTTQRCGSPVTGC
jgi:DNA-binding SARP family transcriptional activator/DNA-binding beta-propeller fold protein YncE